MMLGIPMCLLYELGVLAVRWLVKPGSLTREAS
jgi:sec-independent protein translocase protein TatC